MMGPNFKKFAFEESVLAIGATGKNKISSLDRLSYSFRMLTVYGHGEDGIDSISSSHTWSGQALDGECSHMLASRDDITSKSTLTGNQRNHGQNNLFSISSILIADGKTPLLASKPIAETNISQNFSLQKGAT
eukprot:TRINITY_DN5318_c1_g1_i4.p1 TRINITY_DN5318_c1_g1~~TRINITY_DN5318_c1_g1_i4.p1  ORF type:complete len:133 (-),score=21.31 TRINITY_DN5318_c1_g1_i4:706-1104(-)